VRLRIATWNMSFWQRRVSQESSWRFLDEVVKPDLALLQECVPPPDRESVVYREGGISDTRRWGSAVVSYGADLEPITEVKSRYGRGTLPLLATHPGSVAVAKARIAAVEPVVVVSAYGLLDEGYAITTVHKILSDLMPLIDSPLGRRIVIGGDLNCSTQLRPPDRARHVNFFERVRGLGLIDLLEETRDQRRPIPDCICDDAPSCGHVQTHRHPQSEVPWQMDYLFASRELASQLVACYPVDGGDPDPWELSDHCPVVAEFNLTV
jgi:endonuclease/exonuclease/phosphatase family metal-dependent hydrolase